MPKCIETMILHYYIQLCSPVELKWSLKAMKPDTSLRRPQTLKKVKFLVLQHFFRTCNPLMDFWSIFCSRLHISLHSLIQVLPSLRKNVTIFLSQDLFSLIWNTEDQRFWSWQTDLLQFRIFILLAMTRWNCHKQIEMISVCPAPWIKQQLYIFPFQMPPEIIICTKDLSLSRKLMYLHWAMFSQ